MIAVILAVALRPPHADGTRAVSGASREAVAPPPAPLSRSPTHRDPDELGALPRKPAESVAGGAPCPGCLSVQAVLDVVETLLFHLGVNHLDIRAEMVADIPWLTPERRYPPLPDGIEGAPRDGMYYGRRLPAWVDAKADEIWVVWYQTGWMSHEALEDRIRTGDFPPVARSWPALPIESYVLVNARSGEVDEHALRFLYRQAGDQAGRNAWQAATERVRHWLGEASGERVFGPSQEERDE